MILKKVIQKMSEKNGYLYSFKFLYKGTLGYIAYISIFPTFLCPLIHRLRGVKLASIYNIYIAPNVIIDSLYPELLTIEKDVYITRGVRILTHFNPTNPQKIIIGMNSIAKKVLIKEGAFIGVNSIINAGIEIGKFSIVAAGSVVVKNVSDYKIVGGNPAKEIGDIRTHKWSKND